MKTIPSRLEVSEVKNKPGTLKIGAIPKAQNPQKAKIESGLAKMRLRSNQKYLTLHNSQFSWTEIPEYILLDYTCQCQMIGHFQSNFLWVSFLNDS